MRGEKVYTIAPHDIRPVLRTDVFVVYGGLGAFIFSMYLVYE